MELSFTLWNRTGLAHSLCEKILFLHGMGGTGALWRPISAGLEEKMAILAPDQRGHGRSLIPHLPGSREAPQYTPLDYGKDLVETLEKTQFHPTWVVGHSMGVRSAVALAYLKPEWVKGLILVDLGFSGVAGGGLGENLAHFLKLLPLEFKSRQEARTFMTENCPDPSIGQYLMAVSSVGSDGKLTFPFDHSALIQTIYAARDVSIRTWIEKLETFRLPILVLRGMKSLVWSHEQFEAEQERFKSYQKMTFKEVPDAGHGLPFEQRVIFIEMIQKFISEHQSAA